MGRARISWTREAKHWIQEIREYIAQDNPSAAKRTARGILERAQALADHPELGYRYKTRTGREVRLLLYGHYRIAYLIKASGDIDILGVFHGSLDLDRHLP